METEITSGPDGIVVLLHAADWSGDKAAAVRDLELVLGRPATDLEAGLGKARLPLERAVLVLVLAELARVAGERRARERAAWSAAAAAASAAGDR